MLSHHQSTGVILQYVFLFYCWYIKILKFTCHMWAQPINLFKLACSCRCSNAVVALLMGLMSPANFDTVQNSPLSIKIIYTRKRISPKTNPCSTPLVKSNHFEAWPAISTLFMANFLSSEEQNSQYNVT